MHRVLATSMAGFLLGWGGVFSLPGYKPYVFESGYKPYIFVDGYKPYITGKGFKPFVSSSSSSSRRPLPTVTCDQNGWLLPSLIRGNEPLTFCQVKVRSSGGVFGSDEWLSL